MNLATALLYPVMLLLPAASTVEDGRSAEESGSEMSAMPAAQGEEVRASAEQTRFGPRVALSAWPFAVTAFQHVEPQGAWQVRIEQRMTIRITPRASRPASPDMFVALPEGETGQRFVERKIGKCLSAGAIAGVQPDGGNRLLLFMQDRRIVSAELERACSARDFYSGFYLSRSSDGKLCIDRDTLLSRSGMNCKLTRIRELVEVDD
ncbi:hypothetical protein GCM10011494_36090 [Novosphingobium endophyticum]|uniref:Uncharacterized protein n=1 Tax=Novosphingobium endophyticum TaxID=1955250 RepID=A0A916X7I3_9SPHN|nr:hypothetical protein [Novosphingobium endophyticum]GGC14075.1 hypothetical protein GCM10011494_36090 [Novosphingobium endophyticum]